MLVKFNAHALNFMLRAWIQVKEKYEIIPACPCFNFKL